MSLIDTNFSASWISSRYFFSYIGLIAYQLVPTEKFGTDGKGRLGYSLTSQPSLDNNTVDLDRERANFVDNAVRYEATLRFLNGQSKTMLSAITGQ